jgi:diguanylate cyclase (GGDEF)-like protein
MMDKIKKVLTISSDPKPKDVLDFCLDGWGYEVFLRDFPAQSELRQIKKISPDAIVIDIQSARKEHLDFCRLLKKDFVTAFIPVITLINKRQLRAQLLHLKQGIDDYLIKPPDPLDLRIRIEMAVRRAQHSIHASSLTGLPGAKMLEDILRDKYKRGEPFSFAYVDIDNFKYFNDAYGYHKGDGVILQTAHILLDIIHQYGNPDDFISHIGGDDFAFITSLDRYEHICQDIIEIFDRLIPFHYSQSDRMRGFVVARDRMRKAKNIPLMSLSISVINREYTSAIQNIIQINEKIAEIKRYLKTIPESAFMADRRDAKLSRSKTPHIHKKTPEDPYRPLGQILLERNSISYEQLDEALNMHWKKKIILGEVLKELGFIDDRELGNALAVQKNTLSEAIFEAEETKRGGQL